MSYQQPLTKLNHLMVCILLFVMIVTTQSVILPPPAVARLCGNFTVREEGKIKATQKVLSQGCDNVTFVHIGDGWWLAYGVKVYIGE